MAAAIKKNLGINAEYIKSGGGRFEVMSDGKLIYSKLATGKFPTDKEIINKLKSMQ